MNNKDKNANYKLAPNMYDYLLNTNINNITKKDIDYLKSLFSSVSLADRTSKRVRRASKAFNNEPFPDFAYTPADRKNEFLSGLYSLAFQLHKSMGKSADTFEFQVYLRPYDSEKTKSKDNNNNNDSSNEPEN